MKKGIALLFCFNCFCGVGLGMDGFSVNVGLNEEYGRLKTEFIMGVVPLNEENFPDFRELVRNVNLLINNKEMGEGATISTKCRALDLVSQKVSYLIQKKDVDEANRWFLVEKKLGAGTSSVFEHDQLLKGLRRSSTLSVTLSAPSLGNFSKWSSYSARVGSSNW